MVWIWWETSLMPGEGWIVTRWEKHGTQFATEVERYDRLVAAERDQLLEDLAWTAVAGGAP